MPVTPETVGSVGEFPLIERITSGLAMGPAVSVGPGDDAAVFLVNGSAVTSVDVLVEGVHFRRDWVPAERLGRRAVAVSQTSSASGTSPASQTARTGRCRSAAFTRSARGRARSGRVLINRRS